MHPTILRTYILKTRTPAHRLEYRLACLSTQTSLPHHSQAAWDGEVWQQFHASRVVDNAIDARECVGLVAANAVVAHKAGDVPCLLEGGYCMLDASSRYFPARPGLQPQLDNTVRTGTNVIELASARIAA